MEEWANWAMPKVEAAVKQDALFQEFSCQRQELDPVFTKLVEAMEETEREQLLEYFCIIENLWYQRARVSYEFGKQVGRLQERGIK